MRTPYDVDNSKFSNEAHEEAKGLIYPQLFEVDRDKLTFTSTLLDDSPHDTILDGEMGIDRLVHVRVDNLRNPLKFTVQERFRREDKAHYRDLTITEWNRNSNLPSELYKINAGLFVYGYYSIKRKEFIEAIAVSVTDLLMRISAGEIRYTKGYNPRSKQDFICLTFDELIDAGCVVHHQDNRVRQLAFSGSTGEG